MSRPSKFADAMKIIYGVAVFAIMFVCLGAQNGLFDRPASTAVPAATAYDWSQLPTVAPGPTKSVSEKNRDYYHEYYKDFYDSIATPSPAPTARRSTSLASVKATARPSASSDDYAYIGNKRSDIFHKPTCSSVRQMNESNKVFLKSRQEAIDKGYRACQRCHP